jgi:hypothetical protein
MKLSPVDAAIFCLANVLFFGSLLMLSVHLPHTIQPSVVRVLVAAAGASLLEAILVLVWPTRT